VDWGTDPANKKPLKDMDIWHGTAVAAKINGKELGSCKLCTVVYLVPPTLGDDPTNPSAIPINQTPREFALEQLVAVYNDIIRKKRKGKAVVNMSFSYNHKSHTPDYNKEFRTCYLSSYILAILVC